MCCFTQAVERVADTRIFARVLGERQALVYEMTYAAAAELAMVLPVPVTAGCREADVEFVSLEGYPAFFSDLERACPEQTFSLSADFAPETTETLRVQQVGAFEASFVPTAADFSRLDARFRLAPDVLGALPSLRDHGFAVFKLRPGELRVHPLAFFFPTRDPAQIFFPTVHVHDGRVPDLARFDHTLFFQGPLPVRSAHGRPRPAEIDSGSRRDWASDWRARSGSVWEVSKGLGPLSAWMDVPAARGLVSGAEPAYRISLGGRLRNRDTVLIPGPLAA